MDPQSLVRALGRHGVATEVNLLAASSLLTATDRVLTLRKGSRVMNLNSGALYELLMELYDVNSWAAAIAEVLDNPDSPRHPVPAFTTTRVWR